MSCELFKSEMYTWRPGSDTATFQPLFEHLNKCCECARLFEQLTAADQTIQRTIQKLPADRSLESRILAGLAHQREHADHRRTRWKPWLVVPLAACLAFLVMLGVRPQLQEARLHRDMATLLSQPPEPQISSDDRKQLLDWSARVLAGIPNLPPELNKVEFRGAAALKVNDHRAVLLRMKNEPRASLLIVDALLAPGTGFKSLHEKSGSASMWSHGQRTYVLLYQGSMDQLHAYMEQMGIDE